MTFDQFKNFHSETIMYCQRIEHDLKWIYSFMHKGNPKDNFDNLEKTTLGMIVKKLKELDNTDGKPFISNNDYNFLKQMTEKRNYWCHKCFIEFIYEGRPFESEEYKRVCKRLQKDYNRLKSVSDNTRNVLILAMKEYAR